MSSLLAPGRKLRAALTTPSDREVDPQVRGFYDWADGPSIVVPVGRAFLRGFRIGMEQPDAVAVMRWIQRVPRESQGFAAEGAGMSVAMRGAIEPWHRNEFHKLVSVSGGRHSYMMHVGLGWALARLPRSLWPDLSHFDPQVAALILDGFGFHEVFFKTKSTLSKHTVDFPLTAWPGPSKDAHQQLMQGVGRGLWFVAGGSPTIIDELIDGFDPEVHPALWAGVGLAATYAGGRKADGLYELASLAGAHAPWLRQGCTFAVEARVRANTVNEHTQVAAEALCGQGIESLVEAVRMHLPTPQRLDSGDWAAYEEWRALVAGHVQTHVHSRQIQPAS